MSARMSAFGEQTGLLVLTLSFVDPDPIRTFESSGSRCQRCVAAHLCAFSAQL